LTFGEALMRWSVRLSVLLMLAAWMLMLRRPSAKRPSVNWCWTLGFLAFLVHLWAAFEYVHHWSHSDAVEDTARQTKQLVGLDWGGGVWFNYLFALVWGADVVWRIGSPNSHDRRPNWIGAILHGYLGFIAFNATVVFAVGFSRWLGVAGCVLLAVVAARRQQTRNTDADRSA
jgi:hypothetical protein